MLCFAKKNVWAEISILEVACVIFGSHENSFLRQMAKVYNLSNEKGCFQLSDSCKAYSFKTPKNLLVSEEDLY